MSITPNVQAAKTLVFASSPSFTVTLTGVTAGNLLSAAVSSNLAQTLAFSAGSWVHVPAGPAVDANGYAVDSYYCLNAPAGTVSVFGTGSGFTNFSVTLQESSPGAGKAFTFVDSASGNAGSFAHTVSAALTAGGAGEYLAVAAAVVYPNIDAITAGSGFTLDQTVADGGGFQYLVTESGTASTDVVASLDYDQNATAAIIGVLFAATPTASTPVLTGATVNATGTVITISYTGSTPTDAHGAGTAGIIGNASCTAATGAIALGGGSGTISITGHILTNATITGSLTLGAAFINNGTQSSSLTSFALAGSTYLYPLVVTATAGDPATVNVTIDPAIVPLVDSVIVEGTSGIFTPGSPLAIGAPVTASAYTAASGLFATGTALAAAPASGGSGGVMAAAQLMGFI